MTVIESDVCQNWLLRFKAEQCPLHPTSSHPLVLEGTHSGHTLIFCQDCRTYYEPLHFLAIKLGISVEEVCAIIAARSRGLILHPPPFPTIPRLSLRPSSNPSDFSPIDTEEVSYWSSRGLTLASIKAFGAGAIDGVPSLPVYDGAGVQRGLLQRNPAFPPDTQEPTNGLNYFMTGDVRSHFVGWDQARLLNAPYRVLVEGPVDAMRCWEAGVPAIAMNHNVLSSSQVALLASETRNLLIAVDNDAPGNLYFESRMHKVYINPFFRWARVELVPGVDPGAMTVRQLRDAVDRVLLRQGWY